LIKMKPETVDKIGWGLLFTTVVLLAIYMIITLDTAHYKELPQDNIYQKLAPLYSVCYQKGNEILCCAEPIVNVSSEKKVLICDKIERIELRDRILIIR